MKPFRLLFRASGVEMWEGNRVGKFPCWTHTIWCVWLRGWWWDVNRDQSVIWGTELKEPWGERYEFSTDFCLLFWPLIATESASLGGWLGDGKWCFERALSTHTGWKSFRQKRCLKSWFEYQKLKLYWQALGQHWRSGDGMEDEVLFQRYAAFCTSCALFGRGYQKLSFQNR